MKEDLIFDVGMHLAQDTAYYLNRGYRVVAVDALPQMVDAASKNLQSYVAAGKLQIINYAMSDSDDDILDFNISDKTEWSSFNKDISNRQGQSSTTIQVRTKRLSSLFREYGVPYYCKIDVEGLDECCIRTLSELSEQPKFISCESECFTESQVVAEEDVLATLNALYSLGYTKFKLVEQDYLLPLEPGRSFYKRTTREAVAFKALRRLVQPFGYALHKKSNRELLSEQFNYQFPFGATGPFGNDLAGKWLNYSEARETLLFHRNEFFSREVNYPLYTIWCDWHATY